MFPVQAKCTNCDSKLPPLVLVFDQSSLGDLQFTVNDVMLRLVTQLNQHISVCPELNRGRKVLVEVPAV